MEFWLTCAFDWLRQSWTVRGYPQCPTPVSEYPHTLKLLSPVWACSTPLSEYPYTPKLLRQSKDLHHTSTNNCGTHFVWYVCEMPMKLPLLGFLWCMGSRSWSMMEVSRIVWVSLLLSLVTCRTWFGTSLSSRWCYGMFCHSMEFVLSVFVCGDCSDKLTSVYVRCSPTELTHRLEVVLA